MPYPFESIFSCLQEKKLIDILRMECELMYYLHMPLSDIEVCNRLELDWIYQWLIQTKKDENDQIEKAMSK